jgi:hypothetical protein
MPRWTEGIDYKVLKSGKVRCLYCEYELDKTELSSHLSTCPERKPLIPNKAYLLLRLFNHG